MKIELVSKDSFNIFINIGYFKEVKFNDKDNIIDIVKDFILKMRHKLKMSGFYKVKVYVNKKVGMFLDIIKIEDIEFSNNIDLRVIVCLNEDIYFETDDYYILPNDIKMRYFHGKYYVNVNDVDNIYNILEFGRFIYGNQLKDIINKSKIL